MKKKRNFFGETITLAAILVTLSHTALSFAAYQLMEYGWLKYKEHKNKSNKTA